MHDARVESCTFQLNINFTVNFCKSQEYKPSQTETSKNRFMETATCERTYFIHIIQTSP